MNKFESYSGFLAWVMALLLVALAAGCGGGGEGRDPILGIGGTGGTGGSTTGVTPDTTRPRVQSTVPPTTIPPTANVATNSLITALFTEEMAQASITAAGTVTVTCAPACAAGASLAGVASYVPGSRTAIFTPTPAGTVLEAGKTYTVTITTAATDLASNQLAGNQAALPAPSNYIWSFTTLAPLPVNPVTVGSTNPTAGAGPAGVCPNATINATFTVPSGLQMNPATVNTTTFTVTGPGLTPVAAAALNGVVLDGTGLTATFTPLNLLTPGVLYTATIRSGAAPAGVEDLAIPGNFMVPPDFTWTFTAGPAAGCLAPIVVGSAIRTFGIFGGAAGMTNAGNLTIISGDIGTIATGTSSITGFHDSPPLLVSDSYTEACPGSPLLATGCGLVNGTIYTCTVSSIGRTSAISIGPATQNPVACGIATTALGEAGVLFGTLAGLAPGGASPAPGQNLAGLTLLPGVYTAPTNFLIQGGDLTLDPAGDANAVWVFQMASTLTVGGPLAAFPQSVILIPPAQSKNVFWQVGSSAVINAAGGGTMVGTIITGGPAPGINISTSGNIAPVILNGRAITTTVTGASVTVVNTVINVPPP